MSYLELNVKVSPSEPWTEILIAGLEDLPFDTFEETDEGFKAWTEAESVDESLLTEILTAYPECKCEWTIRKVEKENWNAMWESSFAPVVVEGKVAVRAGFHKPVEGVEFDIVITPKMSFGTGHHQTTWLMMKHLTSLHVTGEVLDMGCGTGVLAILACKMGADKVAAVDIDDWAVTNTIENAETNGTTNCIEAWRGDIETLEHRRFNLILANINRNILLRHLPAYFNHLNPEGKLLLSGFYREDIETIRQAAEETGLSYCREDYLDNWSFLMFEKK